MFDEISSLYRTGTFRGQSVLLPAGASQSIRTSLCAQEVPERSEDSFLHIASIAEQRNSVDVERVLAHSPPRFW